MESRRSKKHWILSSTFYFTKNSELINLSGIQYIISPDRTNNQPTLNRVEENSAVAEAWTSAQEPFSLVNKAGTRNLTDAYSDENISTALLNEANIMLILKVLTWKMEIGIKNSIII